MKGPKITVIGAGSYFFGRPILRKMATSPWMAGGTLALVDTDPTVLQTMMDVAKRLFAYTGSTVKLEGSTERVHVLADSDFVILTFSQNNAYYRKLDTEIAKKYGIRMCSSDTIGPGGIFRAMRELPTAIAIARDVEQYAPQSWLMNYVNPASVLGIGIKRYVPQVRSFSLCDGHREPENTLRWCKKAKILPDEARVVPVEVEQKLKIKIAGVNHCTWLFELKYEGEDRLPLLRQYLEQKKKDEWHQNSENAKKRFNYHYASLLFDLYDAYPTVVSHTKEYVPFFQGYGINPVAPEPLRYFDADERIQEMHDSHEKNILYATGKKTIEQLIEEEKEDHATDILEAMWVGSDKSFYINIPNQGAVTNLSDDAFLELRCQVSMKSIQPEPFGPMPRGLLALQQQILDTHELTVEAAMTGSQKLLRRAMLTDPICNNIADADACIQELLAVQRSALPSYWYNT